MPTVPNAIPVSQVCSAQPSTSASTCSGRASVVRSRSLPSRPSSASRAEPPTRCSACPAAANRSPSSTATGETRISSRTAFCCTCVRADTTSKPTGEARPEFGRPRTGVAGSSRPCHGGAIVKSALDVHRELLAAGVPHEMVRVRGGVLSADDLPAGLGADPQVCVAVRCYIATYDHAAADRRQFVAVLLRSGDTPDPASLLEALQASAVRPATDAETNATTDYAAPLVCPVGLGPDVLLLADAAL